jgi:hypothetical protein
MTTRSVSNAREARNYIIEALRQELVGPAPGYRSIGVQN